MTQRIVSARSAVGLATAVVFGLGLAACGDATGPEATTTVAFRTATGSGSSSLSSGDVAFSHTGDPDAATLEIDGTNGRLTLATVHFILAEFELERAVDLPGCDEGADDDACEEFEAPMQFLELPLSGEDAVAVRQAVPADRYDELEFAIEDLEDDEDDDDAAQIEQLLADIREQFPDWPRKGSVRIHGTFTPKDDQGNLLPDQARDFTAIFEAEVEIEKEFASPVEIGEDSRSITVTVDPRVWFERGDGTVPDLSQFDFDPQAGGPVPEFEVEIESGLDEGFVEVEFGG